MALIHGARVAVNTCLGVRPGERVLIIADITTMRIGEALVDAAEEAQAETILSFADGSPLIIAGSPNRPAMTEAPPGGPNGNGAGTMTRVDGLVIYLATSLVFDSGFELQLVGPNSPRVACGPTIAEPGDLQPRKPARKPQWKNGQAARSRQIR